ncbi:MAG: 1,4-alpha-glucan branching protein [Actinomycetota bacterium]
MRRFALVLHTHLPYVRRNGTWPCGEDFYHQAATESYLPLIGMLQRLRDAGVRNAITIGITPVLAEQMHDAHMREELSSYLARYELRAMQQVTSYKGWGAAGIKDLAAFYARFGRAQMARFDECEGDLTKPFAALQRDGVIELLGGPATHPLLPRTKFAALQLRTGLASHERLFGVRPRGIWLPECAVAPGVEQHVRDAGVERTIVDETCVDQPSLAGEVAFYPLDRSVAKHVWAPGGSYPSGEWYRDFHAYDLVAGFKNWRVTDATSGWLGKELYEPAIALEQAENDAQTFVRAVEQRFDETGRDSIIACFDTELFGHWWFEGPGWLEHVLTRLNNHPTIRPVTLSQLPTPTRAAELRESTWGDGADFRSWDVPDLWKRLHEAEAETEALLPHCKNDSATDQLLRELMLLQSSDWPYLVVRGQNAGYARQRFDTHWDRWSWLADALGHQKPTETLVADLSPIDNVPVSPR